MKKQNMEALLRENHYPGRGIILGRSADDKQAVIAYFIMGRSENSRNRIFTETEDGIRTEAYDTTKMTDPSLIIYHPVRKVGDRTIVTNGDQTDTIMRTFGQGGNYHDALIERGMEPDEPNFTPRISGVVDPFGAYDLSILKSMDGTRDRCIRSFFEYDVPIPGAGHFIHTYEGDGSPLPSFEGEPRLVSIDAKTAQELADRLWNAMDADNKVSLFVRYIDLESCETNDVIINKNV